MRITPAIAILLLLVPSLVLAQAKPGPPGVAQAIKDLGAEKLETRIAAREFLWKHAKAAAPALKAAAKSNDLEVAATALYLLDRLELGLSAEMPAEVIRAAEVFRYGSEQDKQRALPVLIHYHATVVLLRLASHEPSGKSRTQVMEAIQKARGPLLRRWLADGDFADLELFLKELSTTTGDCRDYASYLSLRGLAAERIKSLRATPTKKSHEMKLLALLLRLEGDLPAAVEAARQASDENLVRDLLVELGDWAGVRSLSVPAGVREKTAWLASVYRLAGDKDGSAEQIKALKLEVQAHRMAGAVNGLEINDHVADAIDTIPSGNVAGKMTDLAVQGRMVEALACVGIDRSRNSYLDWLKGFYPQLERGPVDGAAWLEKPNAHAEQLCYRGTLEAAVILASLGERRPAVELVERLAAATDPDDKQNQFELYKTYRKLGTRPQMFAHGARVLALSIPGQGLDWLYNRNSDQQLVRFWWDYLDRDSQTPPAEQRLQRADELAFTSLWPPRPPKPSVEFLREAETWVRKQFKPPQRTHSLLQLSQACLRYGYRPLAIELLSRAADESQSSAMNLELGLLYFGQQDWTAAAERFGLAYDQDPTQTRARFMKGHALLRAGQQAAGESELDGARLSVLADVDQHGEAAKLLYSAGLYREAAEEWQLCVRFSDCTSATAFNANQGLGNVATLTKDPAAAARYWDRCALSIGEFAIYDPGAVIRFNHTIHLARARGLIEAGEIDRALAEAALSFEAVPGDVELPIALVPMLEAAGRDDAAEQVFQRTFLFYQRILKKFPQSSYHLNASAWLAAVCHRHLDEALQMAKQAVALAPDHWAYTDTLAEVFFQLGDRDQALAWAAKGNRLEPDNPRQQKRLEHFRHDPLPRDYAADRDKKQ